MAYIELYKPAHLGAWEQFARTQAAWSEKHKVADFLPLGMEKVHTP